jgi:hypothetical protein
MPAAILLGIVALILMIAATTYSMGRIGDHDRRRDRVVAMPVVDTAVTRLKTGLEQNLLAEHRDYRPEQDDMEQLIAGSSATLIPGSVISPAIPGTGDHPYPMLDVTVREPIKPGLSGYWQLLRIFAPEYTDPADEGVVVAYLRAWTAPTATPAAGTEPRLVRVEFRPGRFADYQAVIDGPIVFGGGATLNGPIHSNGFDDERSNFLELLSGVPERVSTVDGATVSCFGSAQITTAEGTIATSRFPGCPAQANTRRYVNLLAAEGAFDRIRTACAEGAPNARCFDTTLEGSSVPDWIAQKAPDLRGYRVQLEATRVIVSGYEIDHLSETAQPYAPAGLTVVDTPPGSTTVLFFADNVLVSGTTNARVTIAARKPGEWTTNVKSGAANIYVGGNTTHEGDGSVLGLMAQGGVILEAIKAAGGGAACTSELRAGIVAMSGTLTIDPRYTTRLYQAGAPSCPQITVRGSIAAHRSPVLIWSWANRPEHAGYLVRDYRWSDSLRRNPPPYFPTTDTWEARHVRPANLDCFSGGDITDPDC